MIQVILKRCIILKVVANQARYTIKHDFLSLIYTFELVLYLIENL